MARKFSRELRAVVMLVPVLAVASWLVWQASRPRVEEISAPPEEVVAEAVAQVDSATVEGPELFVFDPNSAEYHDFIRLGFTRGEALGIVKYRARGKIFEIPEDFAACYQVTEAMYRRLKPYIRIAEKYRLKPFRAASAPVTDTTHRPVFAPLQKTVEAQPVLVDINTADSAALVAVRGIGARTAGAIVTYRARLGGFAAIEQLGEVRGVTEQNFEMMRPQIYIDPVAIVKININFAPAKVLADHPYIGAASLRKLLKQRQLKGGWGSSEELTEENIFTQDELKKLGPYLDFN